MDEIRNYSIKGNRIKKACMRGFILQEDVLVCGCKETARIIFLGAVDGIEEDTRWGRFTADIRLGRDMSFRIHVTASNHKEYMQNGAITDKDEFLLDQTISDAYKKTFFESAGEKVFVDKQDFLLYDVSGRYLWLYMEVTGEGEGCVENIMLRVPGDHFMNSYPQVYREWGSFFHRYLSVFSSLYYDFHKEIKTVGGKLDAETAPAEMLPLLASWLGIDVSGNFLEEDTLRTLVKEGYRLNRIKGSRQAAVRIAEIVLGERVILIEKQFDITMLVTQYVEEKKKSQLSFLLKQYLPVRCRINIVYLECQNLLDTYCYLDINAVVYRSDKALLDRHIGLDNRAVL